MDIQAIKQSMKERKITQQELSQMSGVPLQTIKCIFLGRTKHPRINTMKAIEKALGLDSDPLAYLSKEKRELLDSITQMSAEEIEEIKKYTKFLISQRK